MSDSRRQDRVAQEARVYNVDVIPDGEFYLINVPEIGRSTQARHRDEIEMMARDLIAGMLGVNHHSFEISMWLPK